MPSTSVSLYFATLMPISSPCILRSAPPELPGLMAASVWSRPDSLPSLVCTSLSFAEMIPVVTD